ncbi:MAG TPA: hypothetical protein VMS49_09165, partial [Lysobacter sp.]|nr:hypothetical protein [Lysobacter sp.]
MDLVQFPLMGIAFLAEAGDTDTGIGELFARGCQSASGQCQAGAQGSVLLCQLGQRLLESVRPALQLRELCMRSPKGFLAGFLQMPVTGLGAFQLFLGLAIALQGVIALGRRLPEGRAQFVGFCLGLVLRLQQLLCKFLVLPPETGFQFERPRLRLHRLLLHPAECGGSFQSLALAPIQQRLQALELPLPRLECGLGLAQFRFGLLLLLHRLVAFGQCG